MFRFSPIGMVVGASGARIIDVNPAFCAMLGYERDELIGRSIRSISHPDDRVLDVEEAAALASDGGGRSSVERRFMRRDGTTVWTRRTLTLLEDETGAPALALGMIEDITESRTAGELYRRQRQVLHAVSVAAERLMLPGDAGAAEAFALEVVGEAAGADEAYVAVLVPGGDGAIHPRPLARWERPGLRHGSATSDPPRFGIGDAGGALLTALACGRYAIVDAQRQGADGVTTACAALFAPIGTQGAERRVIGVVAPGDAKEWLPAEADAVMTLARLMAARAERGLVEEALQRSEERLELSLAAAEDAVWDWDLTTGAVYRSPQWATMLGRCADEVAATIDGWRACVHPEDLAAAEAALADNLDGRTPQYVSEHRLRRSDGSWAWVAERGNVVARSSLGAPVRMSGRVADISARKIREARDAALVRISEMRDVGEEEILRQAVSETVRLTRSSDGYVGFVEDDQCTVTPVVWPVRAPSPRSAAGGSALLRMVSADPWDGALQARRPVLCTAAPGPAGAVPVPHLCVPVMDGDGVVMVAGVMGNRSGYHPGDIADVFAVMSDAWRMVCRRRTEIARELSESRLRQVFDIATDGFWNVNMETRGVQCNARCAEVLGYTRELVEDPGTDWRDYIHAEDVADVDAAFSRAALLSTDEAQVECRARAASGEWRWMLLRGRVVSRAPDATPERVLGTMTDITETRRLMERIARTQKLESIGRLAGGIAHDFNNLLTAIMGYTDIAANAAESGSPLRRHLSSIRRASERAAALTQQLLAFARRQTAPPHTIDLNACVEEMSDILRRLVADGTALSLTRSTGQLPVRLDAVHLEQVLVNLVVNARDAMPDGGTLEIVTGLEDVDASQAQRCAGAEVGAYVTLTVSDTGTGMDDETLQHLFEPFFTTKPVGQGTGLGLATCYGIVTQANGFIEVRSSPGEGSRFAVYLPVSDEAPRTAEAATDGAPGSGAERILLVEDEAQVREVGAHRLRALGYQVFEASDGVEAIMAARTAVVPFDLMVTDVVMPHMGGIEAARRIREIRPDLKVLFVSGYLGAEGASALTEFGDPFLAKPFTGDALARKIRQVIDG